MIFNICFEFGAAHKSAFRGFQIGFRKYTRVEICPKGLSFIFLFSFFFLSFLFLRVFLRFLRDASSSFPKTQKHNTLFDQLGSTSPSGDEAVLPRRRDDFGHVLDPPGLQGGRRAPPPGDAIAGVGAHGRRLR